MSNRNLTDDDVAAIVTQLKEGVAKDFYNDIGQGVMGLAKKLLIGAALAGIGYMSVKGIKF